MLFLMLEESPYEEVFLYPHSHLRIYLSFMVYLFASMKSYPNISSESEEELKSLLMKGRHK